MVEKYKDEGRKAQIAALTGGRYLGTCRNRIGDFLVLCVELCALTEQRMNMYIRVSNLPI